MLWCSDPNCGNYYRNLRPVMRRLCRGGDGDGNANGTTTHHALWDNNDKENKPRFRVQGKLYCGNKAVMFKQWKHLAQQSLPPKR